MAAMVASQAPLAPDTLPGFLRKICPRADVSGALAPLAKLPRPWVFTNGVFDVALNTDASVKRLGKGDDRPLNQELDRAIVMASQEAVSLVTWFDEDTPMEIIAQIRPDILVKGGDYDMARLPETALVQSWGGHALALPFVAGYSTTNLVRKIRAG